MSDRINGIYYILNIHNHRIYIGQSGDVKSRWTSHLQALRSGRHTSKSLQADWDTYGAEAFVFDLLIECPEWSSRIYGLPLIEEIERIFIHAYQASDPIYGYNCDHKKKAIDSHNRSRQLDIEANAAAQKYRIL